MSNSIVTLGKDENKISVRFNDIAYLKPCDGNSNTEVYFAAKSATYISGTKTHIISGVMEDNIDQLDGFLSLGSGDSRVGVKSSEVAYLKTL